MHSSLISWQLKYIKNEILSVEIKNFAYWLKCFTDLFMYLKQFKTCFWKERGIVINVRTVNSLLM